MTGGGAGDGVIVVVVGGGTRGSQASSSSSPHLHHHRIIIIIGRELRASSSSLRRRRAFGCLEFEKESEFVFEDDDVNSESKISLNKYQNSLYNYQDDFPKRKLSLTRKVLRIPKKSTQNFSKTVCLAYGYQSSVR